MINPTYAIFKLADVCTDTLKLSRSQPLSDEQVEAIEAKIVNIQDYTEAEPQACYILCNRMADLQKSLKGDSPKVLALKTKLSETLEKIKASLPDEFLKTEPTFLDKAIPEGVKDKEFLQALVSQFPPVSREKIKEFIGCMKIMFKQAQPEYYNRVIAAWVDYHKIPIHRLVLTFESLLEIIPLIDYVDCRSLDFHAKFGFEQAQSLEKLCLLIERSNPIHFGAPTALRLTDSVLIEISQKKNLKSLDLSECDFEPRPKVEYLKEMPKLEMLNIRGLRDTYNYLVPIVLPSLAELQHLRTLIVKLADIPNDGLEALAACTHLQKLELYFHEMSKIHDLSPLGNLIHLTSLTIQQGYRFEAADFQFLEKLTQLNELEIDRCSDVTNAIVYIIPQNLQKLTVKRSAHFDFNANLASLTKLETLLLEPCWNLILDDLLELKDIKTLKHLTVIQKTSLTDDERRALLQAMPQLETFTIKQ